MNVIANPGVDKADFELWCTTVSAINGCGACLDAHEEECANARSPTPTSRPPCASAVNAVSRVMAGKQRRPRGLAASNGSTPSRVRRAQGSGAPRFDGVTQMISSISAIGRGWPWISISYNDAWTVKPGCSRPATSIRPRWSAVGRLAMQPSSSPSSRARASSSVPGPILPPACMKAIVPRLRTRSVRPSPSATSSGHDRDDARRRPSSASKRSAGLPRKASTMPFCGPGVPVVRNRRSPEDPGSYWGWPAR